MALLLDVRDLVDASYTLLAGVATAPAPIPIGPKVYHGLELDLSRPWLVLARGVPAFPGPEVVDLRLPAAPGLVGLSLHVQGLASTSFEATGHPYVASFSNLVSVALD